MRVSNKDEVLYMKKKISITLEEKDIEFFKALGNGNISGGLDRYIYETSIMIRDLNNQAEQLLETDEIDNRIMDRMTRKVIQRMNDVLGKLRD